MSQPIESYKKPYVIAEAGCSHMDDVYARPRRQDFDGWWQGNGAIYVTTRDRLLESRNRVSGRIGPLEMAPEMAFEIDGPSDWEIIEALLARRESQSSLTHSNRVCSIKLLLTDCDGCLTDGGMYYGEGGDELKRFDTRDGMAFQMMRERGVKVGIITGENSHAAMRRAEKLSCDYVELSCRDKLAAVRSICEREGISFAEVAYVGDDLNDLYCINAIRDSGGLTACPHDAIQDVRDAVDIVLTNKGGHVAIRELVTILIAKSLILNTCKVVSNV